MRIYGQDYVQKLNSIGFTTEVINIYENYKNFATSYRKGYLYWLHSAKREVTRQKWIAEIIQLCAANKKQKDGSW